MTRQEMMKLPKTKKSEEVRERKPIENESSMNEMKQKTKTLKIKS